MHPLLAHINQVGPERCLVLVPRQTAARALQRELTPEGTPLFGLRIETPATIMARLTLQVKSLRPLLDDSSAEIIIGDIARRLDIPEQNSLLRLLTRASGKRVALASINELRLNGYTPEQLLRTGSSTLHTLAAIMKRYDDFCQRNNVMDWLSRQIAVIETLEKGEAKIRDITCFILTSFSAIPHHYHRLICALAKGRQTILNIPLDSNRAALFADGIALAESLDSYTYVEPKKNEAESILNSFRKWIFSSNRAKVPEAAASVRFHSLPSRFDEVEAAAMEIDRLLNKGVPASDIGLAARTLPDYDDFISTVFEKFNIPYFYRRGVPMLQSPVIRMAMKLTELGEEHVRFDALLGVLRSRFMPFDNTANLIEKILIGEVHSSTSMHWLGIIEKYTESEKSGQDFLALFRRCAGLHKRESQSGAAANFLPEFREIIKTYISKTLAQLEGTGEKLHQQRIAIFKKHLEVFDELLANLDRNIEQLRNWGITDIDALQILRNRISNETIAEEYPPQEAVRVFNFFDMGYQHVNHLFILGMDEHSVPRSTQNAGLIGEEELAALEEIRSSLPGGFGQINTAASRRRSEERDFVLALNAAHKSIDFYAPKYDSNGTEITISPYLSECMWIAGVDEPAAEPGGDIRSLADVQPDDYSIRRQILRHLHRTDIEVDTKAAKNLYIRMLENREDKLFMEHIADVIAIEDERRKSLFQENSTGYNKWTGRFRDQSLIDEIAATYGDDFGWSATALQAYARSPFAFFVQEVLRLRELSIPLEDGDPRRLGSLYHHTLQKFIEQAGHQYPLKAFAGAAKSIEQSVKSAFEQIYGNADPINLDMLKRIYYEQTNAVMRSFLNRELQQLDNKPILERLEYEFGGEDCVIELPEFKIRLRGRFDRVDLIESEEKIRLEIIDYKKRLSDKGKPTRPALSRGENLQLPIYLLAASKLFDMDLDALRGRLMGLENNEDAAIEIDSTEQRRKGAAPTYAQFMGLEPGAETTIYDLLQTYVKGVRRGDFSVTGVLDDRINLVGRWLELPPELVG